MNYSINKEKTLAQHEVVVINPLGTSYQLPYDANYIYEVNGNNIEVFPIPSKVGELLGVVIKNTKTNELDILDPEQVAGCGCNTVEPEKPTELPDIFGNDDAALVTVEQIKNILRYFVSNERQAESLASYLLISTFNKQLLDYPTHKVAKEYVEAALVDYATKNFVTELVSNYATIEKLSDEIAKVVAGSTVDLQQYAKHTEVEALYAKKTLVEEVRASIPDISPLATKVELATVKNSIPDITPLATKDELNTVKTSIPSIADLATKAEVTAVENKIPSLADYATQEFVQNKINGIQIPSLDGYAKTTDLDTLATKAEVKALETRVETLENNGGGVQGGVTKDEVVATLKADNDFLTSVKGEKGDKGEPGEKGDKGEPGEKGDPVDTSTLQEKLTAGDGITIDAGTIKFDATTYKLITVADYDALVKRIETLEAGNVAP